MIQDGTYGLGDFFGEFLWDVGSLGLACVNLLQYTISI